jgi:hypothetical protein
VSGPEPLDRVTRTVVMRSIPVHDRAALPPDELRALETALQSLRTLADVLAWARSQMPPRIVTEVVTQDEYTHDVVLEATGLPYLVFDTT